MNENFWEVENAFENGWNVEDAQTIEQDMGEPFENGWVAEF